MSERVRFAVWNTLRVKGDMTRSQLAALLTDLRLDEIEKAIESLRNERLLLGLFTKTREYLRAVTMDGDSRDVRAPNAIEPEDPTSRRALAGELVGRKIADVEFRPFADGSWGIGTEPVLVLDSGLRLVFRVRETESFPKHSVELRVEKAKGSR